MFINSVTICLVSPRQGRLVVKYCTEQKSRWTLKKDVHRSLGLGAFPRLSAAAPGVVDGTERSFSLEHSVFSCSSRRKWSSMKKQGWLNLLICCAGFDARQRALTRQTTGRTSTSPRAV